MVSFSVEVFPCVELELLFCFDKEILPDLLSDLDALDLDSDLFPEDLEPQDSQETSPFHSQYHASIA